MVDNGSVTYMDIGMIKSLLPDRPDDSHKGDFGKVLAMVGSPNYVGAAHLACEGASRVGAGLVTLAVSRNLHAILASKLTETTYLLLDEDAGLPSLESYESIISVSEDSSVFLAGCGLDPGYATTNLLTHTVLSRRFPNVPVGLDASALTCLSKMDGCLIRVNSDTVITPHSGEMARLSGISVDEIKNDRLNIAINKSVEWGVVVVLKGPETIVASPDGLARVSPYSNAGLASAGTGDVLAGMISGFIAQGLSIFDAASCAVYIHAHTADMMRLTKGNAGILATDLLLNTPNSISTIRAK